MKDFSGDPRFPIWLIGDSPPKQWANKLEYPLDPKHPARHNIWTSVVDPMQDALYRRARLRLDTSRLYIRNALGHPKTEVAIPSSILRDLVATYKPSMILTFGVAAFAVTLLSLDDMNKFAKTATLLGDEFRSRVINFNENKVNVIPLLHVSIARGKFLEAHSGFVGGHGKPAQNYFDYVGETLADLLLTKFSARSIWIA